MKAIMTRFKGCTNTKGSRIIASDEDGNKVILPYPHELNSEEAHMAAAQALCEKMKWPGTLKGGAVRNGYAFVFVD